MESDERAEWHKILVSCSWLMLVLSLCMLLSEWIKSPLEEYVTLCKRLVKFLHRMPSPWPGFSLEEPVDTFILSLSVSLILSHFQYKWAKSLPALLRKAEERLRKQFVLYFMLSDFKAVGLVKAYCLQRGLGSQQAAPISYACPEENVI